MDLAAGATTTTTLGLGLSRNLETGGNLKLAGSATQLSAV
jgi:hypothetical protein